MAPSLTGLPVELLLKVVEADVAYWQLPASTSLRKTCQELNEKLSHFFGLKYFKHVSAVLTEEKIRKLRAVSKSDIGLHTREISLHISTLFKHISVEPEEESTDASRCSWYEEDYLEGWAFASDQFEFANHVAKFITDGSCSQLLGEALSGFSNATSLSIHAPMVFQGINKKILEDVRSRWSFACKALLYVFFTKTTAIEKLEISNSYLILPVPLSAIDVTLHYWAPLTCLKTLDITFTVDVKEASYPIYTRSLAQVFAKLPNLTDLGISFNMAPAAVFKELPKITPKMRLEHLKLKHITTRYKYLALFLDECLPTLLTFTLDCIDLTRPSDEEPLFYFLAAVSFQRTLIRGLNVDSEGVQFSAVNEWIAQNLEKDTVSALPDSKKQYQLKVLNK